MSRLAYEEAAEYFAQALTAPANNPGLLDSIERTDLLLALGDARRSAGDTARARPVFLKGAEAAGDDPARLSAAALGFADPGADLGLAFHAGDDRTRTLLERALAAVGDDDSAVRVALLARLAAELYFSGEPERSRPLSAEAVEVARRLDDPRALVSALAVYHDGFVVGHADTAAALAGSAELLRQARATGDNRAMLAARRARVFDLLASGDLAGVDAEVGAFSRLAGQLPIPAHRWWVALWKAMRALLDGRHDEAERLALEAQAIGERPFPNLASLNLSFQIFYLRREQGRLGELEGAVRAFGEGRPTSRRVRPRSR
jgi:hypothetical protein